MPGMFGYRPNDLLMQGLLAQARAPSPQGSLQSYRPTLGERVTDYARSRLLGAGVKPRIASKIANLVDFSPVGVATTALQTGEDLRQSNYRSAAVNGISSALNAVPDVGPAAKAMFLGVMAKNADKIAFRKAEQMAAKGADRVQIWNDTGWFKGADKKWRFEVPDNALTTNMSGMKDPDVSTRAMVNRYMQKHYGVDDFLKLPVGSPRRNEANSLYAGWRKTAMLDTQPLSDVVRHSQLEANYDLSGVKIAPATVGGYNGNWHDSAQTLRIRPGLPPEKANSVAAHELQHAVQGREGFATGGNLEEFDTLPSADANDALVLRNFVDRAGGADNFSAGLDAYRSALGREPSSVAVSAARQYDPADLQAFADPLAAYRRLAGEVEARNTEARLGLSAAERHATPPWQTQDTPDEWQIVRFGR